jgi:hypothetical protein
MVQTVFCIAGIAALLSDFSLSLESNNLLSVQGETRILIQPPAEVENSPLYS